MIPKGLVLARSILIILGISLFTASCIKEFEPDLELDDTQKIIVSGQLNDQEAYQYVSISKTSGISKPKKLPISSCIVKLISSDNKSWDYTEYEDGEYRLWLNQGELDLSKSYKITILTADMQKLESSFETISKSSPIDSIYFEKENRVVNIAGDIRLGLQFLLNIDAKETESRYYRFEVIETYEYHTLYPIEWWYDGVLHHVSPPDYSKQQCWSTTNIKDIFVLSTDNLSSNQYIGLELNYTENYDQRLSHYYSLLVKQYAISKEAYTYWEQMRINFHQEGGLYENQPISIKGNITNTTNSEKVVLGYFSVVSFQEKRIIIPAQPDIDVIDNHCQTFYLRRGLRDINPDHYPGYLLGDVNGWSPILLSAVCVDCTARGGSTTKPDYWP